MILRLSPKVPYVDETALEKESNELSQESKELLSIYHKTFDDERVSTINKNVIHVQLWHMLTETSRGKVEAPPQGPNPYLFISHYREKRKTFHIPPIEIGTPLHAYRDSLRWGWGYSTTFDRGKLHPKVQTLTFLYPIIERKEKPFIYLP